MKTLILLARHGETEWTVADRFNGRTDLNLTEHGCRQASGLAKLIAGEQIAACYTSPLLRCRETARLALNRAGIQTHTAQPLIEMNYGVWEGLARGEIMEKYPLEWQRWVTDPAAFAPPQGETAFQIAARVIPFIEELAAQWTGQTLFVVAHKAVNRILLAHALGISVSQYRNKIVQHPSGLNRIEVSENGTMQVVSMNEAAHFAGED